MRIATDLYTKVTRSCKYLPLDFLEAQYATSSNLNSADWISCFLVSTCHRPAKPPESSSKWINGNLEPQSKLQLHHALANCSGLWTPLSVLLMINKKQQASCFGFVRWEDVLQNMLDANRELQRKQTQQKDSRRATIMHLYFWNGMNATGPHERRWPIKLMEMRTYQMTEHVHNPEQRKAATRMFSWRTIGRCSL